jgi:PAS domain S-box-containing protein
MNDFFSFIASILTKWSWLVNLAAILTALGAIYKYLFLPGKTFIKRILGLVESLEKTYPIIEQMARDFKPNGGNSLRDVIDRIERKSFLIDEKFKLFIDLEEIGVFETDSTGKYTWVSEKWMEITGQNTVEASNHGWLADVHPDDINNVTEQWEKAIAQARQFHMKYRVGENETAKSVETVALPIKNRANELVGYIGRVMALPLKLSKLPNA